jgi:hypothetical protein
LSFVICHLSFVIGYWSFVICHLSLVIGHLSFVICHWLLVICHLSFVICHWLLVICKKAVPMKKIFTAKHEKPHPLPLSVGSPADFSLLSGKPLSKPLSYKERGFDFSPFPRREGG